jgi:hypothetical protein
VRPPPCGRASRQQSDYGIKPATRASLTRMWQEAHREGRVQAVALRASDFYGPFVTVAMVASPLCGPRTGTKFSLGAHNGLIWRTALRCGNASSTSSLRGYELVGDNRLILKPPVQTVNGQKVQNHVTCERVTPRAPSSQ